MGSVRQVRAQIALAVLGVAAVAVLVGRWSMIGGLSALADYGTLALVCAAVAAGTVGVLAWRVSEVVRSRATRVGLGLGAVLVAAAVSAGTLVGWAGADPHGRYDRAYGRTGGCLAGTAYAGDDVRVALLADLPAQAATPGHPGHPGFADRMVVRPVGLPRTAELVFDHAGTGARPVPENTATEAVLRAHGCTW
ncbi:hypothetical protein ACN20G_34715 (plasmid) [Streptomyces sp. BI20]|uniref:hypothetical protein n=1 Tax=Streptomyces sp. BI20 TaxID=3403460 RepID=UPI003C73B6E5